MRLGARWGRRGNLTHYLHLYLHLHPILVSALSELPSWLRPRHRSRTMRNMHLRSMHGLLERLRDGSRAAGTGAPPAAGGGERRAERNGRRDATANGKVGTRRSPNAERNARRNMEYDGDTGIQRKMFKNEKMKKKLIKTAK